MSMSLRGKQCPVCEEWYADWAVRCPVCGVALVHAEADAVDGNDGEDDETGGDALVEPAAGRARDDDFDVLALPEDEQLVYELAGWSLTLRTEVAAALAEARIAHAWDGTDLLVAMDDEAIVDDICERLEAEFGPVPPQAPSTGRRSPDDSNADATGAGASGEGADDADADADEADDTDDTDEARPHDDAEDDDGDEADDNDDHEDDDGDEVRDTDVSGDDTDVGAAGDEGAAGEEDDGRAWAPGQELLEYDLAPWAAPQRRALRARLDGEGVVHRMEGTALVVAAASEPAVEAAIDWVSEPGRVDAAGVTPTEEGGEGNDDDGVYVAMSNLFLAADRLQHDAEDREGTRLVAETVDDLDGDAPPFGVDPADWQRAVEAADALADALADADTELGAVTGCARQLRAILRPLV